MIFSEKPAPLDHALRIEPRLGPWLIGCVAAEFDAVVQAERTIVPEFELHGGDTPAAPPGRTRHLADHIFGRDQSDRLFEGKTALERLRLLAGPRADPRLLRPGREIGVGFSAGDGRHGATDPDLPAQRFPME